MSLLEGMFVTEILFLFAAWVMWFAGSLIARNTPNDALFKFARVFWRTMALKPAALRDVIPDEETEDSMPEGTDQELLQGLASETSDGEGEGGEKGGAKKGAAVGGGGVAAGTVAGPVRVSTLGIMVVPGASRDQISGWLDRNLKIQVTAPAEGGAANKAVIDLLATTLGLKPHQIQLTRGHYQALKVVQIAGLSQDELSDKLANFQ